ncbi:MAG: hypothetical protein HZC24_13265, partial [Rhodocyclales bacterium]|nr:hypothetical protein [Rhodocyclales bacterium]
ATASADITPATIQVTAANGIDKPYDATTALPASAGRGFDVAGVIGNDVVAVSAVAAYDSANPGSRIVEIIGATAQGADAGNYVLNLHQGTGTIAQLDLPAAVATSIGRIYAPAPEPVVNAAAFIDALAPTAAGIDAVDREDVESVAISPLISVDRGGLRKPAKAGGR